MEFRELVAARQEYQDLLWQVAGQVAAQLYSYGVHKVILFGSVPQGKARLESDVDLLVIWETNLPPPERTAALYRVLGPQPVPVDLIVLTPQEADIRCRSAFGRQIFQEGVLL
ncbi:MAG: nucleotidyltransferase domain-containing protein [Firmicutes bacterium]|nr:nucleotidyltransferase domain-containing protein [Bacillota bacterium]